jgi:hypothetical protein
MQVKIDSGADSPQDDLRAAVVAYSGKGEGFDERKQKEVYVSVYRRGSDPIQYLYSSRFEIVAAQLDWNIKWKSRDEVQIDFFEYPPGISRSSDAAVHRTAPIIELKSVTLMRSGETAFREKS